MHELQDRLQRALANRYRIERELGSGGMGVVFLAADLKLGRLVAIKVLRPEIAQAIGNERFLREIQISAQLSHPHILSLIDSGVAEGLLYYVMFYVQGETVRDRLTRESQLPVDEAVRIALQTADALDHAHRHGVIHRDIKPENILLEEGHALVCDFGIARAVGEAGGERLTSTGFVVGTPAYMSPEQGTGEVQVDHRADIYALGCVLYEMLMGTPPFVGVTPQVVLARKCTEQAPGLRAVRDTVPLHVEQAILRALSRTPADRFQTAGAFAGALTDAEHAVRETRRRRWKIGTRRAGIVVAAAVVGALAAGSAGLILSREGGQPSLRVRSAQVTALPGLEDSPSFSPDGQWFVYAGDNGADRDIYLRSLTGERAIDLTEGTPGDDFSPAFSPDGQRIAFRSTRAGGGLFVMGRTGEAVRRVVDRGEDPSWSPDGQSLAYTHEHVGVLPLNMEPGPQDRGLWTVDLETGTSRKLVSGDAVLPSWSPDGRWIAYTSRAMGPSRIWLAPPGGGTPVQLSDDAGNDWGSSWSPDGRFLYFSSDRGGSTNLWRVAVDPANGRARTTPEPVPTPSPYAAHPNVSSDGAHILFASVLTTQNIERARIDPRADTLVDRFALTTGSRQWSSPDPSPDGSRIAFYSRDLPEGDLYIVRRDGTGLRQLTGDSAIDRVPLWSPDGTRIAYFSSRSGTLTAWVINADGSGNRQLIPQFSAPGAWSPDGQRMAILRAPPDDPYILDLSRSWDQQTLEDLVRDTAWGTFIVNDWSPDGTRLAGMRGYSDQGVGYYDLATGRHVRLTDFGQWPVWMPDSRHLLFISGRNAFYMVDSETREVRRIYSTPRDNLGPPRLTADGREVVYSRRHTEGDIWLVTIESGQR